MNLLIDKWIPVFDKETLTQISLLELLCTNDKYELVAHRDDMQLAALQLIICLVQSVFYPKEIELKNYLNNPLTKKEYQVKTKAFLEQFNVNDLEHPFMQRRGIAVKDIVPIQKLFNGLPEGNNHTWHFDSNSKISKICSGCASIMLFNQATNTPSFGGGFKNPLRGAAPIVTLIEGKNLRETIWLNVLSEEFIEKHYGNTEKLINLPNWLLKVNKDDKVEGNKFGLLRGLFWQPASVELVWENQDKEINCDSCSIKTKSAVTGFKRQAFVYDLVSPFTHPHSPRYFISKDGIQITKYEGLRNLPWWTQVVNLVLGRENTAPALVVSQYKEIFPSKELRLIFGGYANNQAKITQRSYKTFSLPEGWLKHKKYLEIHLAIAVEIGVILRKKGYGIGKSVGLDLLPGDSLSNLLAILQDDYYQEVEPIIIDFITNISNLANTNDVNDINEKLLADLETIGNKHITQFAKDYSSVNIHNLPSLVKQSIELAVKKLIADTEYKYVQ